jgi:subtilisin family serine protease
MYRIECRLTSEQEFGGHASWAGDFIGRGKDDQGHGTHCAGAIGSSTYGVAKKASSVVFLLAPPTFSSENWFAARGEGETSRNYRYLIDVEDIKIDMYIPIRRE